MQIDLDEQEVNLLIMRLTQYLYDEARKYEEALRKREVTGPEVTPPEADLVRKLHELRTRILQARGV